MFSSQLFLGLASVVVGVGAHAPMNTEIALSENGKHLSVSFMYGGKHCKYNLAVTRLFTIDANVVEYTDQGAKQRLPPQSRTFISREPGMSGTAILESSTNTSRTQISGLFLCENSLIDIPMP